MQDFTGVPAVVDLAAMRDAMTKLGGDPQKINPLVPVDLVIDHSVIVDAFGSPKAFKTNVDLEYEPQRRALPVLEMGAGLVRQFPRRAARHRHLPSGQSRISRPDGLDAQGEIRRARQGDDVEVAYPDTLVGTDSHTTMVNGLSVLGWGVGGIEAEACMLGQPLSMLLPEVIGFKLTGELERRRHRHRSRADRHADAAQKGRRRQVRRILRPRPRRICRSPTARRSPIWRRNMARPAASSRSTARRWIILRPRRAPRPASRWSRNMPRRRACTAPRRRPIPSSPTRWSSISPTVVPSMAGPKRPEGRIALESVGAGFKTALAAEYKKPADADKRYPVEGKNFDLGHGDVVIAAITSCTNTSNPSVLIGAGPACPQRRRQGLDGQALGEDLARAGQPGGRRISGQVRPAEGSRQARLQSRRLRLHDLHRQFAARLPPEISKTINEQWHRRRGGALRQPQFRRPRQPRRAGQLSRLAAARRRPCARRHGRRRI